MAGDRFALVAECDSTTNIAWFVIPFDSMGPIKSGPLSELKQRKKSCKENNETDSIDVVMFLFFAFN